jgi:hypothetical protein
MPTKRRRVSEAAAVKDEEDQEQDQQEQEDLEMDGSAAGADDSGTGSGTDDEDDDDDEVVVKVLGSLDADGLPHGRATVHYASGDVFRGRFHHGQRTGKGALEFADDGSIQTGTYSDDELEGEAVCEYPSGERMVAHYVAGVMEGPWEAQCPDGSNQQGEMAGGQRVGKWTFAYPDGGILGGDVDADGDVAGSAWTYSYPDGSVLHGSWVDGQMEKAYFVGAEASSVGPAAREVWYSYDPGTASRLSATPRVRDPYEALRCEAKPSPIGGSFGEGLFAKRQLAEGEVACFYAVHIR